MEKEIQEQKTIRRQKRTDDEKEKRGTYEFAILKEMEDNLRHRLGTKVFIKAGMKEGKIEISFYNHEDLERLLQLLLRQ